MPPALGTEEADEINLLEFANVLLKRWKLVVGVPLTAALVAAVYSLLVPPNFTATATFFPEREASEVMRLGGLGGLASQFGIGVGGGGSAQFYADVMGIMCFWPSTPIHPLRNPVTVQPWWRSSESRVNPRRSD